MYYIGSRTGDAYWHKTSAKTLMGAKRAASSMYEQSLNGRIEVGYAEDGSSPIRVVAVKYGYETRWAVNL